MLKFQVKNIFLGFIIGLFVLTSQTTKAQENIKHNDSTKVYTIENCVNQFDMDKTVKTNTGYQYWFADKDFIDGRTIKMSVVAPMKSTHEPHKHLEDEFFYILEGTAKFFLDGKSVIVGSNTSLYCPSMVMHGISNVGETELKYLVIKKYQK